MQSLGHGAGECGHTTWVWVGEDWRVASGCLDAFKDTNYFVKFGRMDVLPVGALELRNLSQLSVLFHHPRNLSGLRDPY